MKTIQVVCCLFVCAVYCYGISNGEEISEMENKTEISVTADFSEHIGWPLVKSKFSAYNSGFVPGHVETYKRDIHLFDEVRPASLRFDGGLGSPPGIILSEPPMVSKVSGAFVYNFSQSDELIALLHEHNVQPYWCYSYIPQCLVKPGQNFRHPPSSLEQWSTVVGTVASHFRETGHHVAYHEIYNEPDNRDFFEGDLKDYLALYETAVKAIREADPEAKVGGPALAFTDAWVEPFLAYVVENDLPLDFFSFHFYPGVPYSKPSIHEVIDMMRSKLEKYPELDHCEMHLTEYNALPINYPEDGPQQKHCLAALLLRDFEYFLTQPCLTQVHWAQFMDTAGGNWSGMISVDGHRKAVFNAWKIYTSMPVKRSALFINDSSGVSGMASSDVDKSSVVLWNLSGESRNIIAELLNIPFPEGTMNVYRIDSKHSSWGDDLNNEDIVPIEVLRNINTADLEWKGEIPEGGVIYLEVVNLP